MSWRRKVGSVGASDFVDIPNGKRVPSSNSPVDPSGAPVVGGERHGDVVETVVQLPEVGDAECDVDNGIKKRVGTLPVQLEFAGDFLGCVRLRRVIFSCLGLTLGVTSEVWICFRSARSRGAA